MEDLLLKELIDVSDRISAKCKNPTKIEAADFDSINRLIGESNFFVAICDMRLIKPVFICKRGLKYLGLSPRGLNSWNYAYFYKFIHPDNLSVIHSGTMHFIKQPSKPFSFTLKVHNSESGWKWMYAISKSLKVEKGETKKSYTITLLADIHQFILKNSSNRISELSLEETELLSALSKREREILIYIGSDMPTKEIASKLYLSEHTVATHRKRIIKKLNVRTSLGLVKYALFMQHALPLRESHSL